MNLARQLLLAFKTLTRIPVPLKYEASAKDHAAAVMFYPVVSFAAGACMLLAYGLSLFIGFTLFSSFIAVMAGYTVAGARHINGFANCCGAFFPKKPKEEIIQALQERKLNTAGVLGIVFDLGVKTLLLYALAVNSKADMVFILLLMPLSGKLPLVIMPFLTKDAPQGIENEEYISHIETKHILVCLGLCIALLALFFSLNGVILFLLLVFSGAMMAERFQKSIGGITEDILNTANEAGEMLYLLILIILYTV